MDGIGDTVLQLVLNSGSAQQEQVPLNELSGLVQCFATSVDCSSSFVVDLDPLLVFLLRNLAICDAERTQTFRSVILFAFRLEQWSNITQGAYLQMDERLFDIRLVFAEAFQYDRIGTFAVDLDLAVWTANNGRHAFAGRIEFANIQYLVFVVGPSDVHEHGFRFTGL